MLLGERSAALAQYEICRTYWQKNWASTLLPQPQILPNRFVRRPQCPRPKIKGPTLSRAGS